MSAERSVGGILTSALLILVAWPSGFVRAEAPAQAEAGPETFGGIAMIMSGKVTGMKRFRATVERWSTDQDRKAFAEALRSKGMDGLVAALEGSTMGYIQFDDNVRWPIRLASSWRTEKGQMVRLATNRRMAFGEAMSDARSRNYPIGVMEFLLPPQGKGEGSLLGAVKVQFDEQGRLEVQSLPENTGPQQLSEIERESSKPKKEKKAKATSAER